MMREDNLAWNVIAILLNILAVLLSLFLLYQVVCPMNLKTVGWGSWSLQRRLRFANVFSCLLNKIVFFFSLSRIIYHDLTCDFINAPWNCTAEKIWTGTFNHTIPAFANPILTMLTLLLDVFISIDRFRRICIFLDKPSTLSVMILFSGFMTAWAAVATVYQVMNTLDMFGGYSQKERGDAQLILVMTNGGFVLAVFLIEIGLNFLMILKALSLYNPDNSVNDTENVAAPKKNMDASITQNLAELKRNAYKMKLRRRLYMDLFLFFTVELVILAFYVIAAAVGSINPNFTSNLQPVVLSNIVTSFLPVRIWLNFRILNTTYASIKTAKAYQPTQSVQKCDKQDAYYLTTSLDTEESRERKFGGKTRNASNVAMHTHGPGGTARSWLSFSAFSHRTGSQMNAVVIDDNFIDE